MSNQAQKPDISGTFRRYPVPRLLFYLFKKRFTGILELIESRGSTGNIFFRNGFAIYTDLFFSSDVLGRVLLERAMITSEAFDRSLQELAYGKEKQGKILQRIGAIDQKKLVDGLRIQLHRKLNRIFGFHEARFNLYSRNHAYGIDDESAQVFADPFRLIYHGVRNHFDIANMQPELDKLYNSQISLSASFSKIRGRYGMSEDVDALITLLLRSEIPIDKFYRVSNLDAVFTKMLVYTLWVTEALIAEPLEKGEEKKRQSTGSSHHRTLSATFDAVLPGHGDQRKISATFESVAHSSARPLGERKSSASFEAVDPQRVVASTRRKSSTQSPSVKPPPIDDLLLSREVHGQSEPPLDDLRIPQSRDGERLPADAMDPHLMKKESSFALNSMPTEVDTFALGAVPTEVDSPSMMEPIFLDEEGGSLGKAERALYKVKSSKEELLNEELCENTFEPQDTASRWVDLNDPQPKNAHSIERAPRNEDQPNAEKTYRDLKSPIRKGKKPGIGEEADLDLDLVSEEELNCDLNLPPPKIPLSAEEYADHGAIVPPAPEEYAGHGAIVPPAPEEYADHGAIIPPAPEEYAGRGTIVPPAPAMEHKSFDPLSSPPANHGRASPSMRPIALSSPGNMQNGDISTFINEESESNCLIVDEPPEGSLDRSQGRSKESSELKPKEGVTFRGADVEREGVYRLEELREPACREERRTGQSFPIQKATSQGEPSLENTQPQETAQEINPPRERHSTGSNMRVNTEEVLNLHQVIKTTFQRIQKENYFEFFGVTRDDPAEKIRAEYFKLAKQFHPDRVQSLGLKDLGQEAEEIFRYINEAHSILTNPEEKTKYIEELDTGIHKDEAHKALTAEFTFQKALVLLRKKNFAEAYSYFYEAYKLNPNEAEHLAYMAWAQYLNPKLDRQAILPQLRNDLEKALKMSPKNTTCLHFLGEIYFNLNELNRAHHCLNQILEREPNHFEATRLLRLIRMRLEKEKGEKSKNKPGFFGRLRKDKEKSGR